MATKAVNGNVENAALLAEAHQIFVDFTNTLNNRILDAAKTDVNGENRITSAFIEYSQGCIDHGFSLILLNSMKELAKTEDIDPIFITELTAIEADKNSESKTKALAFIKAMRAEGLTTANINDFTADIKQHAEYAVLYGKAQALVATTKGEND